MFHEILFHQVTIKPHKMVVQGGTQLQVGLYKVVPPSYKLVFKP